MHETITAIYEHGVLRPLTPLSLPEHARIQIRIIRTPVGAEKAISDRQNVHEALLDAGLIISQPTVAPGKRVSEYDLLAEAKTLGLAGPISELISAERRESY